MSPIWSNWPGEQVCAPSAIVRPTSEAELADVIAQAAKRGERVRAVGSGHSFTDIACTDGVMIDMTGPAAGPRRGPADWPGDGRGGRKLRALGP
ncbi:oxidoreductase, partial [Mycobacterium tuberculosis T46]